MRSCTSCNMTVPRNTPFCETSSGILTSGWLIGGHTTPCARADGISEISAAAATDTATRQRRMTDPGWGRSIGFARTLDMTSSLE